MICKYTAVFRTPYIVRSSGQTGGEGGHGLSSSKLILHMGAPQGCEIEKFAVDTAVVGLITGNNEKICLYTWK